MQARIAFTRALTVLALGFLSSAPIAALSITRDFSGSWIDPGRPAQGVLVEIVEANQQKRATVGWYTYGSDGQPTWMVGEGDVDAQSIQLTIYQTAQGSFDRNAPAAQLSVWGQGVLSFTDCDRGHLSWESQQPGFASGGMDLQRLTRGFGSRCTGTVIDDVAAGSAPQESRIELLPVAGNQASARLRLRQAADRVELNVEAEGLAPGSYPVRIGDRVRGAITVHAVEGGTRGSLDFRSPPEPGTLALDFDVHGKNVSIEDQQNVLLIGSVAARDDAPPGAANPIGNPPPFGNAQYYARLLPRSAAGNGARGKAELKQRPRSVEFEVEVEHLPAGRYELLVDGILRGMLDVVERAGRSRGEIEFRHPVESGKLPLDFDPIGASIDVRSQGSTVMAGVLPRVGQPIGDPVVPIVGARIEIEAFLPVTSAPSGARARARYERRPDRVDCDVELQQIADGSYALEVGGRLRAVLEVRQGQGQVSFRRPVSAGQLPLDFEPLGARVELLADRMSLFCGIFPTGSSQSMRPCGANVDPGTNTPGPVSGPALELRVPLLPVRPELRGKGKLDYRRRDDRIDFKVEIEDLSDGPYVLLVDGTERGRIQVRGMTGELEFRNPVEPGKLPLNFEPLGAEVQILRDGLPILQARMPRN